MLNIISETSENISIGDYCTFVECGWSDFGLTNFQALVVGFDEGFIIAFDEDGITLLSVKQYLSHVY